MANTPFYTDLTDRNQEFKIRNYVNRLDDKIDYAKWKQDLVLNYNYMPLKNIKEKIQTERQNYIKKMNEEEKKLIKLIDNKEMNTQIENFRDFKQRLQKKMEQIQAKIDAEEMKIKILTSEVKDKKTRVKEILRENMELTKNIFKENGINTKQDIARLTKSQSVKNRLYPLTTTRKNSIASLSKYETQRTSTTMSDKMLFKQCLESLIGSLKGMKSSEDVQSGIYLDIMAKKQHSKVGKYSTKSNICHTLMDRYGDLKSDRKRKDIDDFDITWQTFKQLNWKQIMGIVLVKDRNGYKISKLLDYKH